MATYDYEKEQKRLQALYGELETDEELIEDESSEVGEDNVHESDHNTDTERADSDNESTEEENAGANGQYFLGKDKKTKWYNIPKNLQVRTCSANVVKHLPGNRYETKAVKTAYDSWNLFFSNSLLEKLETKIHRPS
ncbi:hypothetical protein MML48_4g00003909 [Holotrichia oblita]|uniref:Uncharacterized protein n=1 Tax=Holotrichia oblita TaxID=644536 RepID=A0ACB9T6N6_HOLOL|nr:hypothetical protein MML48_4g00003909 [Holotrichia oblita]